ncbi:MAG: hypothetical protein EOO09_19210 [Chitinophagaceae bacterium]|nr:MAG: hypothetical protein EOO09_19210 [Chitinophagaceae bacterium]
MKKISLMLLMFTFVAASNAQSYEDIKGFVMLNQYKKAKEDLDKRMTNAKFASKAEAYILKTTIYGVMAGDSAIAGTPQAEQLTQEAEAAWVKYKEMEPSLELAKDATYKNGPISIYSSYFTKGYKDYEAKKWAASYASFKKVADYSDLLQQMKILTAPLDTNVMILAAYTAENSDAKEDAAKYYTRLADAKVGGTGFEGVYRFLVTYNFNKKDIPAFEKYKALGKELYPQSEFFTYDKTDFAVGLDDNFDSKLKSLEQVLTNDPSNFKANLSLGQVIYDTLFSTDEGAVQPANAAELETKMFTAFKKAAEAKPDTVLPHLFLGDAYMNKSIKAGEAKDKFMAEMKKRVPAGKMPSKEDAAQRDALDKVYADALEGAIEPYKAAAALYAKKGTLSGSEKQQYKKAAGYLGDIYTYKVGKTKGKPENAKMVEEERKWNDLYSTIR